MIGFPNFQTTKRAIGTRMNWPSTPRYCQPELSPLRWREEKPLERRRYCFVAVGGV
jgi:hypothetical protein